MSVVGSTLEGRTQDIVKSCVLWVTSGLLRYIQLWSSLDENCRTLVAGRSSSAPGHVRMPRRPGGQFRRLSVAHHYFVKTSRVDRKHSDLSMPTLPPPLTSLSPSPALLNECWKPFHRHRKGDFARCTPRLEQESSIARSCLSSRTIEFSCC